MSEEKADYIFTKAVADEDGAETQAILPFPSLATLSDEEADQYLVLRCAERMTAKLAASRAKGRGGWHTSRCSSEDLHKLLQKHVEKGDMVDVLNIAGMILARQESFSAMDIFFCKLGPTGAADTRAEKLKGLYESYNWTSQTVGCETVGN